MADKKAFYLTTTLPYVNADPHIGFALEIVHADVQARFHALTGEDVFFNTGTDEHGAKIHRKAVEEGKAPQAYVDEYAAKFRGLKDKLNLYPEIHFIRTTDAKHKDAAQEFWQRCLAKGDIYKKNYQIRYCVGCELEKTDSDLVDGHCPLHPNLEIELIDEENYFFKFSNYSQKLLDFYKEKPDFVVPSFRFNEIIKFTEEGLQDFSISRLKEKMPWGVAVPNDEGHVMYVWFDALVDYISTIDWPQDEQSFKKWWIETGGVVQFAGKDQIRQQAAMWQAMLMSAGLTPSKQIVIHGFINVGGQKMSKSLGNVIDPYAIVGEYGVDPLRYYLARHISPFEDSDFSMEKFKEAYNANLANGLGNLVSRIMKLAEDNLEAGTRPAAAGFPNEYIEAIKKYELNKAMDHIWSRVGVLDERITREAPYKLVKTDKEAAQKIIFEMTQELYLIGRMLNPFMPETSEKIKDAIVANKKPENLFARKD